MTPEEIQELRDWAARKMGWFHHTIKDKTCWIKWDDLGSGSYSLRAFDWQPDRPESGQIWLLVERMRELGWISFKLEYSHELTAYDPPLPAFWSAKFWDYENPQKWANDPNPCLAILKAARATED